MIEIDGSHGEGGGQILRTALSLSCLLGKSFRMVNIRRGRAKPGLMPQHIAAVRAASRICGAAVEGDRPGSTELVFSPGGIRSGDIFFDIGTAGSATLVLQTVLPALFFAPGPSTVTVTGGTHVPFSPPFHHTALVFAQALRRIGAEAEFAIDAYGFYPRGGGRVRASVRPAAALRPLNVEAPGAVLSVRGESGAGNLPLSIAQRQREAALRTVRYLPKGEGLDVEIAARVVPSAGPGTFLFLLCESENAVAGFGAVGQKGKPAEAVGEEAARAFLKHRLTGAALDPHLADQVVLYLALCGEESSFSTSAVTRHLLTNLWTIGLFREIRHEVEGEAGKPGRVRLSPREPAFVPGARLP